MLCDINLCLRSSAKYSESLTLHIGVPFT